MRGASACVTECFPGTKQSSLTTCKACSNGKYLSSSDAFECLPCAEGKFASPNSDDCLPQCPGGSFVLSFSCVQCPPGKNSVNATESEVEGCAVCESGKVSFRGATKCYSQ
jgi:hypothetical protein